MCPQYTPISKFLEDRFEDELKHRVSEVKKRKLDNSSKFEAAKSLLHLSKVGNGTIYCEPHSEACSMTNETKNELKELDMGQEKMNSLL